MKKYITIMLIVSLSFLYLVSCGGGDDKGEEELTVFDVRIDIQELLNPQNPFLTNCPEIANLKLSLLINGNNISGFAELFKFGNIGDPRDVSGLIEDSSFSLEPFSINVYSDPPSEVIPFVGELALKFDVFEGAIIADEQEMSRLKIEGIVSGNILFGETDAISCSAEFTGEFSGEARIPEGCLSITEYIAVDEYWDCPAESVSSLCDGDGWICGLPVPPPLVADGYITNRCEAIGCHTIINCESAPDITNLQSTPGLSGNVLLQDGSIGEPIYGCMSFGQVR